MEIRMLFNLLKCYSELPQLFSFYAMFYPPHDSSIMGENYSHVAYYPFYWYVHYMCILITTHLFILIIKYHAYFCRNVWKQRPCGKNTTINLPPNIFQEKQVLTVCKFFTHCSHYLNIAHYEKITLYLVITTTTNLHHIARYYSNMVICVVIFLVTHTLYIATPAGHHWYTLHS